jgi:Na+(H+)/acetate symporter ActP
MTYERNPMKYLTIYLLNLADYAMTVYWTNLHGIQTEINPLMRMALLNPLVFAIIKLVLFPLLLLIMWWKKYEDAALVGLGMFLAVTVSNIMAYCWMFLS